MPDILSKQQSPGYEAAPATGPNQELKSWVWPLSPVSPARNQDSSTGPQQVG